MKEGLSGVGTVVESEHKASDDAISSGSSNYSRVIIWIYFRNGDNNRAGDGVRAAVWAREFGEAAGERAVRGAALH